MAADGDDLRRQTADVTHSPTVLSQRRGLRANQVLGATIPVLLLVLAVTGYRLCVFQVGGYLIANGRAAVGIVYVVQFSVFFVALMRCFFLVCLPRTHSVPPRDPPLQVVERLIPFECDEDGQPTRCFLDSCAGSYRSVRTRHCRDCQSCKTLFDHHCPFFASCISSDTIKPFICFLVVVLPLIGIAIIPLLPLQIAAVRAVVNTTWSSDWMNESWWRHWYSWAGGPVWRYAVALILGYRRYAVLHPTPTTTHELESPSLSILLIVASGAFVGIVAGAMIATILINVHTGTTAIQVERTRRWRVHLSKQAEKKEGGDSGEDDWDPRLRLWVPLEDSEDGGAILRVDPSLPLFDLGPQENRRRLLGRTWLEWMNPSLKSQVNDTDFNEVVMEQLRLEARKRIS